MADASPWVVRWAAHANRQGIALDLACGHGRHARYLAGLGLRVVAVDRDEIALRECAMVAGVETIRADIENGPWPLDGRAFDVVVVTNYLWRPLLPRIVDLVAIGGLLIYETFLEGHERFGRPTNPQFLLRRGELRVVAEPALEILAFEEGADGDPPTAMRQRICARRPSSAGAGSHSFDAAGRLRANE